MLTAPSHRVEDLSEQRINPGRRARSTTSWQAVVDMASPESQVDDNATYLVAMAGAITAATESGSMVLVEGPSDRAALSALAERRGRNLAAEGITVVAMGGATAIRHFLDVFGPHGLNMRLAGLCDAREEADFRRELERVGIGSNLTRSNMEQLGFYVCVPDLEDELIRALGETAVERVVDEQGEIAQLRTFQTQPAWRERSTQEQLRRFMGTRSGRKIRYGRLLVEALDLDHVPAPIERLLAYL